MGAIILIAIVLPWFLIAVASISMAYLWAAIFYRASARELKVSVLNTIFVSVTYWFLVAARYIFIELPRNPALILAL